MRQPPLPSSAPPSFITYTEQKTRLQPVTSPRPLLRNSPPPVRLRKLRRASSSFPRFKTGRGRSCEQPFISVHECSCERAWGGRYILWAGHKQKSEEKKNVRSCPAMTDKGKIANVCVARNRVVLPPTPFYQLCVWGIAGSIHTHIFVKIQSES